nr:hypothetical protein [uncultured Desulfobacter sp.]
MKNLFAVLITVLLLVLSGCVSSSQTDTQSTSQNSTEDRREVTGRNDWSGYIQGQPMAGSKFNKLEIGMGSKEVMDITGPPTDQATYISGKAFIPFYFGSGQSQACFYYKNMGRLVFASDAGFGGNMFLVGIEYDAGERGYQ